MKVVFENLENMKIEKGDVFEGRLTYLFGVYDHEETKFATNKLKVLNVDHKTKTVTLGAAND